VSVKQEVVMERHWTCNICGSYGVETAEVEQFYERAGYCCGSTRVRHVPGQLLLSDQGGAWARRKPAAGAA